MKEITCEHKNGNVIIIIPTSTVVFAVKNSPDFPMKIKNKNELGDYLAENLLEFNESENGTTQFQQLIEDICGQAYEDAEEWIDELPESEWE